MHWRIDAVKDEHRPARPKLVQLLLLAVPHGPLVLELELATGGVHALDCPLGT